MANSAPGGASDYNTKIIEEFRADEGRAGGPRAGIPLILIHHVGAESGIDRVTPAHPDWYYNLKAPPPDHGRGGHPDVPGPGGGAGRRRPRRAVAHAGRAGPWSARLRTGGSDSGHLTGIWGTWPGQAAPACPACTTT